jgi:Fe-S cluster biogenesis protein NfuA
MSDTERQAMNLRVEDALESIRPHLLVDGGNVELVEVTDDMRVLILLHVGHDAQSRYLRSGAQQDTRSYQC